MVIQCCQRGQHPVPFNTFYKIKQWLRVRRSGEYFGQFDCYLCLRLRQLPIEYANTWNLTERIALALELERCQTHHETTFGNAVSTSNLGPTQWSDGGPHHFKTRYCQWMWH